MTEGRHESWWVQLRRQGLYYARRVNGEDVPLQEGECPDWESLPAGPGARILLCVPGVRVRIHAVGIPTRNRKRFFAAVPFALEDRLFRTPETYHFVPLTRPAGKDGTPVAVVEHEQVAVWTDAVQARNLRLDLLTPEYLLLPEPAPGAWFLDALEKPLLLRFPLAAGGAALDEDVGAQPPAGLQLALEHSVQPPARLEVRVRNQEQYRRVGHWQAWLAERDIDLARTQVDTSRPACLARQPAPPERVNLLTGKYRPGRGRLLQSRRFIPAAGLAAALVLVLAAQWLIQDSRIRTEHERLTRAIEDTYREAFPGARNLVDPRHQMEQRLIAAAGPDGAGQERRIDMLDWLERLAPFLGNGADARLTAFAFDGRQLVLDLTVADFEALETLQRQLAAGARLNVERAELKDEGVVSRITLRAGK